MLDMEVQEVKVEELKTHPKNPRKGNIPAIAESLKKNGQFRPLIVQKGTGFIIGGNHTYMAAVSLKWKKVKAIYLDVDDAQAKRIMVADNRLSDMATYDVDLLADVLKGIPDTIGTGYEPGDVRAILAAIEDRDEDLLMDTVRPSVNFTFDEAEDTPPAPLDERLEAIKARQPEAPPAPEDNTDAKLAELQEVLEAKEGVFFDSDNYWGIPKLRRDMLCDTIPDPLNTWGGMDATPDDGLTTWIYNYGVANVKGLPWERAILSFFTYDDKFMTWWENPAYHTAKAILKGLKTAIVPDFSFWLDEPRYNHLRSAYQAQWMGRFFQEAGLKVIPRFMWTDLESIKVGLLGVPRKPPVAAVCIQAISRKEIEQQMSAEGLREFVKEIQPEALIVYSGNPGKQMVESAHLPKSVHVVFVDNYAAVRRGVVYDKHDGKMALKEKAIKDKKQDKKQERVLDIPDQYPDEELV